MPTHARSPGSSGGSSSASNRSTRTSSTSSTSSTSINSNSDYSSVFNDDINETAASPEADPPSAALPPSSRQPPLVSLSLPLSITVLDSVRISVPIEVKVEMEVLDRVKAGEAASIVARSAADLALSFVSWSLAKSGSGAAELRELVLARAVALALPLPGARFLWTALGGGKSSTTHQQQPR